MGIAAQRRIREVVGLARYVGIIAAGIFWPELGRVRLISQERDLSGVGCVGAWVE